MFFFSFSVLLGYTLVHGEVNSYSTSFIIKFLEFVGFCHLDHFDMMVIEFYSKDEIIFMHASLNETPFMCAYVCVLYSPLSFSPHCLFQQV